jgi:uncharacterized RDD family membrane protein YckC
MYKGGVMAEANSALGMRSGEGTTKLHGTGVGLRFVAVVVDSIVLGAIGYAFAAATGGTTEDGFSLNGGPAFAWLLIAAAYYIVMEATSGATIGKLVTNLKVVDADTGGSISWGAATIRTVMRIIDGLFFYLVGAIGIWTSERNQRFGDRLAHTLVVRKRG